MLVMLDDYITMHCIVTSCYTRYKYDGLFAMLADAIAVYSTNARSKKDDKHKSLLCSLLRPPLRVLQRPLNCLVHVIGDRRRSPRWLTTIVDTSSHQNRVPLAAMLTPVAVSATDV